MVMTGGWVFVVGPARSGTTIVTKLLDLHPDCTMLNDTGVLQCFRQILSPPGRRRGDMSRVRWTTQRAIDAGEDARVAYTGWPLPLLQYGWHPVEPDEFVRTLAEAVRTLFPPVKFFGDKWPAYISQWRDLVRVFPEAAIVRTERETTEIAASLARQKWAWPALTDPAKRQARANVQAEHQVALAAECPAAITVRLEDVNAHPAREARRLLEVVGLDWHTYPLDAAVRQVKHGRLS